MSTSEIISYEGRRFVRTGIFRPPKVDEWFWAMHTPIMHPMQANIDFGDGTVREILRELPAETPAPTAESERDSAVEALRVLNEETVLAGFPGGDRTQTLANVRAMASLSAEAEEVLESLTGLAEIAMTDVRLNCEPQSANRMLLANSLRGLTKKSRVVLARIRAAKEKP